MATEKGFPLFLSLCRSPWSDFSPFLSFYFYFLSFFLKRIFSLFICLSGFSFSLVLCSVQRSLFSSFPLPLFSFLFSSLPFVSLFSSLDALLFPPLFLFSSAFPTL